MACHLKMDKYTERTFLNWFDAIFSFKVDNTRKYSKIQHYLAFCRKLYGGYPTSYIFFIASSFHGQNLQCASIIIIIIIKFHGLSKQSAFIAQLVAVQNLSSLFLKISSDWASATSCGKIPAVHNSLAEEAHSALFQWSVFVQFVL